MKRLANERRAKYDAAAAKGAPAGANKKERPKRAVRVAREAPVTPRKKRSTAATMSPAAPGEKGKRVIFSAFLCVRCVRCVRCVLLTHCLLVLQVRSRTLAVAINNLNMSSDDRDVRFAGLFCFSVFFVLSPLRG